MGLAGSCQGRQGLTCIPIKKKIKATLIRNVWVDAEKIKVEDVAAMSPCEGQSVRWLEIGNATFGMGGAQYHFRQQ